MPERSPSLPCTPFRNPASPPPPLTLREAAERAAVAEVELVVGPLAPVLAPRGARLAQVDGVRVVRVVRRLQHARHAALAEELACNMRTCARAHAHTLKLNRSRFPLSQRANKTGVAFGFVVLFNRGRSLIVCSACWLRGGWHLDRRRRGMLEDVFYPICICLICTVSSYNYCISLICTVSSCNYCISLICTVSSCNYCISLICTVSSCSYFGCLCGSVQRWT